jgi:hypothetical protein
MRVRLFVEIEVSSQTAFQEQVLARYVEHKLRDVPNVKAVRAIYIPTLLESEIRITVKD